MIPRTIRRSAPKTETRDVTAHESATSTIRSEVFNLTRLWRRQRLGVGLPLLIRR